MTLWQDIAALDFQRLIVTPLLPTTKSGGSSNFHLMEALDMKRLSELEKDGHNITEAISFKWDILSEETLERTFYFATFLLYASSLFKEYHRICNVLNLEIVQCETIYLKKIKRYLKNSLSTNDTLATFVTEHPGLWCCWGKLLEDAGCYVGVRSDTTHEECGFHASYKGIDLLEPTTDILRQCVIGLL